MLWVTQAHSANQEDTAVSLQISLILTAWRGLCREVQLARQKASLRKSLMDWSGAATTHKYFSEWKASWIQRRDRWRDEQHASLSNAMLTRTAQLVEMRQCIGKPAIHALKLCFSIWRER